MTIALVLGCCLPFLAPFDPSRNTDFQGLMLLILGAFSWIAVGLRHRELKKLTPVWILVSLYILCCLISLVVNPHVGYNFFGAPYIRLGAAGLIACIGFGLAIRHVPARRFAIGLYALIGLLALVSIPYAWAHAHGLSRVGGVFAQSDIFAVFLGCGLLVGVYLMGAFPRWRRYLFVSQGLLTLLLLLSGTRSVLLLVIILYPLWQQLIHGSWTVRKWLIYAICLILLVLGARVLLPGRVTSTDYAAQSVSYRLSLQQSALQASFDQPLFGYGPGNLADALDCSKLHNASLQETCRQNFFFNSSHNIFLDRVLAIGWLGGLCYLLFVVAVIVKGFRRGKHVPIEAACALLIAGYYLTNVTSVPLELLFWVLLVRVVLSAKRPSRA